MSENQQNLSSKLEKARQQLQKAQARVAQLEAQLSAKSPNTAPVLKSDDDLQAMRHFLQTTLDAFPAHTVVLDSDGTIISANLSWKQFAQENSAASTNLDLGGNYLASCDQVV